MEVSYMDKIDKYELPVDFIEFAFMPKFEENIEQLAEMAEEEEWTYKNTESYSKYPILENYIQYTYKRIAEEKKVAFSIDDKMACFDTGLITRKQAEPIYILFSINMLDSIRSYWHFYKFARRGESDMKYFTKLPEMAFYFDNPSRLVYDTKKELIVNIEHIIEDNKDRFPEPYKNMSDYALQNYLHGCIDRSIERVKRNYKIAVPQYYRNNIQLLIPLCVEKPNVANLAIVVEDYGTMYRASTCLTLDMAINNARLLANPDRNWLIP